MFKKFFAVLLALSLCVLLFGCELPLPESIVVEPTGNEQTASLYQSTETGGNPTSTKKPSSSRFDESSQSVDGTTSSVVSPNKPPVVHSLTPLAPDQYYGLSLLKNKGTAYTQAYFAIVKAVESYQTEVKLDGDLSVNDTLMVFYYYRADYPQHFWCNGSLQYASRNNKVVSLTLSFNISADKIPTAQSAFNNAVTAMLKKAALGDDEYERELILHDALAKTVSYRSAAHAHDAYGALVEGKAVCEGYARALQYLLYQTGIQCLIAEGSGTNPSTGKSEPHAWNVVRIGGQFYHVDATWNDTDDGDMPVMYAYFNLPANEMSFDHTVRTKDCYPLPACTATAANYHVKNGTWIAGYNADSIAKLLKAGGGTANLYFVGGTQSFLDWIKNNHGAVAKKLGLNGYTYSMRYTGKEIVLTFGKNP